MDYLSLSAPEHAFIRSLLARGGHATRKEGAPLFRRVIYRISPYHRLKMAREAAELKEQGNVHFKNGEYLEAEDLYTQAIQKGSTDRAKLFTNRANTRLKLQYWDGAANDAQAAIKLHGEKSRNSIKAYYFLAQAQLRMHHPNDALSTALIGYKVAYENEDSNIGVLVDTILQARKEKWAITEKARIWAANEVLHQIEVLFEGKKAAALEEIERKFKDRTLGFVGRDEEQQAVETDHRETLAIIRENFAKEVPELKERVVPEYLVDNITFAIMQDPVMTRTGRSYERSALIEHLTRSATDPITREPVRKDELLPNINLREACEDFVSKNPWAVDW